MTGQCAEFCGDGHATMTITVKVLAARRTYNAMMETRLMATEPSRAPAGRGPVAARPQPLSWLTTVDHKRIGIMYLVLTAFFFLVGGLMALAIRIQLETSDGNALSPERYDQVFTMHGTTMIFLFVVPIMAAFGNYMVPLQIGARDMAFPRLNAPRSGCCCSAASCSTRASCSAARPDVRLDELPAAVGARPGHGQDFWIVGLHIVGLSSMTRRDQLHLHHPQHARAGDAAVADAAVHVDDRASTRS